MIGSIARMTEKIAGILNHGVQDQKDAERWLKGPGSD